MSTVIQHSPGLAVREIDLSQYVSIEGVSGGAFVGHFNWGPVLERVQVSDENTLLANFGKPTDETAVDWYVANDFLAYTDNLYVVRVVDETTALNASADGNGLLVKNSDHYHGFTGATGSEVFVAKCPGNLGNSIKVSICDSAGFAAWEYKELFDLAPGTSDYAAQYTSDANDEVHIVVIDEDGLFTGIPGSVLEKYAFLSKAKDALNLDNEPSFYGNVLNDVSKYVWYFSPPSDTALADNLSVDSVTVDNGGTGYDGTTTVTFDAAPAGGVTAEGVAVVDLSQQVDSVTVDNGGTGYTAATVTFSAPQTGTDVATGTVTVTGDAVTAITVTNPGSGYTAPPTITIDGDGTGATGTAVTSVRGVITAINVTVAGSGYLSAPSVTIAGVGSGASATAVTSDSNTDDWGQSCVDFNGVPRKFASLKTTYSVSLAGGELGSDPGTDDLKFGWDTFKNPEDVDISLLFVGRAGGSTSSQTVIQYVLDNIVENRKDCVMFCSPDLTDVLNHTQNMATSNIVDKRTAIARASNFAVMDSGWKLRYDAYNDKYRWVPLNGDMAGLCAHTDYTNDPWWSPAGYTRGKIKNAVSLAFNPNKTSRDTLYKQSINPVVSFVGEGIMLYGDKTMQLKPSHFSFINVRRLFIVLEKSIAKAARYQLFEFNDQFTRAQFRNMVIPFLRNVKGRRGIIDFSVVCDDSNNTPEVIDRGEFVASIFIKPNRSINYITLNFVATRTGVEFSEAAAAVASL